MNECAYCGRYRRDPLRRGLCHACYERGRRAGTIKSGLVDATPARRKIEELVEAGWGYRRIAKVARIDRSLLAFIMAGREVIAAKTRDAICGIEVTEQDRAAIAHRKLCKAGAEGRYISPQRKYRHAAREKMRAYRDHLLAEKAKREERIAAFAHREAQEREAERRSVVVPIVREVHDVRCGDCELYPCHCPRVDDADIPLLGHREGGTVVLFKAAS